MGKKTIYVKKKDIKSLFIYISLVIILGFSTYIFGSLAIGIDENNDLINAKYCEQMGMSYFDCPEEIYKSKLESLCSLVITWIIGMISLVGTLLSLIFGLITFFNDILGLE